MSYEKDETNCSLILDPVVLMIWERVHPKNSEVEEKEDQLNIHKSYQPKKVNVRKKDKKKTAKLDLYTPEEIPKILFPSNNIKDNNKKVKAMKQLIVNIINNEEATNHLLLNVITGVMPVDDHEIKKLLFL